MPACAIAATGFRNLKLGFNEHEKPLSDLKRNLRNTIWKYHCKGMSDFYVNCEYGIPLWSAEIVYALKKYNDIKLHIVVPCEEQASEWCEEWRDRYYRVHEAADSIEFVSKQYTKTCYAEADERIAEKSDCILIFGEPAEKLRISEYAKKKGVKEIYVYIDMLLEPKQ